MPCEACFCSSLSGQTVQSKKKYESRRRPYRWQVKWWRILWVPIYYAKHAAQLLTLDGNTGWRSLNRQCYIILVCLQVRLKQNKKSCGISESPSVTITYFKMCRESALQTGYRTVTHLWWKVASSHIKWPICMMIALVFYLNCSSLCLPGGGVSFGYLNLLSLRITVWWVPWQTVTYSHRTSYIQSSSSWTRFYHLLSSLLWGLIKRNVIQIFNRWIQEISLLRVR